MNTLTTSVTERWSKWVERNSLTNEEVLVRLQAKNEKLHNPQSLVPALTDLQTLPPLEQTADKFSFLLFDIEENNSECSGVKIRMVEEISGYITDPIRNVAICLDAPEATGFLTKRDWLRLIRKFISDTRTLSLEERAVLLDSCEKQTILLGAAEFGDFEVEEIPRLEDVLDNGHGVFENEIDQPQTLDEIIEGIRFLSQLPVGNWQENEISESLYAIKRNQLWQVIDTDGSAIVLRELDKLEADGVAHIVRRFRAEFGSVSAIKIANPTDYWMQSYACQWMATHKLGINFSAPGRGKSRTIPRIAMHLNFHAVLIIAPLSVIGRHSNDSQYEREIASVECKGKYTIHKFSLGRSKALKLDPKKRNYIFINPEQFQLKESDRLIEQLATLPIDMIVVDEFQFFMSKEITEDDQSGPRLERFAALLQSLPDTKLYLMSATPYRTTVAEPVSVLEYATGYKLPHLMGRSGFSIGLKLRAEFLKNGFRFLNTEPLPELCFITLPYRVSESDRIAIAEAGDSLAKEQLLCRTRLEFLNDHKFTHIPNNPINYSTYVDSVGRFTDGPMESIGEYTGRKAKEVSGFADDFDVWLKRRGPLKASSPFAQARDGAQRISDTLIIWATPPTGGSLQQLIGRIHRPGSVFEVVYVYYPLAINVEYDRNRYVRLIQRGDFLGLLQDGPGFSRLHMSKEQIDAHLKTLEQEVNRRLERYKNDLLVKFGGEKITASPRASVRKVRLKKSEKFAMEHPLETRAHSLFSNATTPEAILNKFDTPESEWTRKEYFEKVEELSAEWVEEYGETPQQRFLRLAVKPFPNKSVAILGCGADLPGELPNKILLLDLLYNHPRVVNGNMTATGEEANSYDVVASILSCYKRMAEATLTEMYRITKPGGEVWLVKSRRHQWYMKELPNIIERAGFLIPKDQEDFVYDTWQKKFRFFRAVKPE